MAKLKILLLLGCLLAAEACNPDSRALDSSENLITSPRNVVQALTLDVPWACWQVSPKENKESFLITPTQWLRLLKAAECENRRLNEQYPQQTRITVAVHMPHRTADSLLYLRQAPLYFSDSISAKRPANCCGWPAFPIQPTLRLSLSKAQLVGTMSAATYAPFERLRR